MTESRPLYLNRRRPERNGRFLTPKLSAEAQWHANTHRDLYLDTDGLQCISARHPHISIRPLIVLIGVQCHPPRSKATPHWSMSSRTLGRQKLRAPPSLDSETSTRLHMSIQGIQPLHTYSSSSPTFNFKVPIRRGEPSGAVSTISTWFGCAGR